MSYKGFLNNKRIYENTLRESLRVNEDEVGNKSMGINSPVLFSISSNTARVRSSVRLEHRTLNPRVAGSIPVGPANSLLRVL